MNLSKIYSWILCSLLWVTTHALGSTEIIIKMSVPLLIDLCYFLKKYIGKVVAIECHRKTWSETISSVVLGFFNRETDCYRARRKARIIALFLHCFVQYRVHETSGTWELRKTWRTFTNYVLLIDNLRLSLKYPTSDNFIHESWQRFAEHACAVLTIETHAHSECISHNNARISGFPEGLTPGLTTGICGEIGV